MNIAIKIEDLACDAEYLRSVILATFDAIYNGANSYKEFEGALNVAFVMSHNLSRELDKLTNEVYEWQRKEKEDGKM